MKKTYILLALSVLCGCGGDAFGTGSLLDGDGGGPDGGATVLADGAPAVDAGAGAVQPDAQATTEDAGTDTGVVGHVIAPDAGGDKPDAGVEPDSEGTVVDAGHDSGCAPVTHSNGAGQSWQDCVPLGTYDEAQARRACAASTGDATKCYGGQNICHLSIGSASDVESEICATGGIPCWGYDNVGSGHVHVVTTTSACPGPSDPTWN